MDIKAIITQMGILVLLMLVGFVCAKLKVTGPAFNKAASPVVMNVLLVATILNSVMGTELTLSFGGLMRIVGLMFVLTVVSGAVGAVVPKLFGIKGDDAGLATMMIMFMNSVFVAFPVIQSIYGQEGIFYASMSNIPFNILLYTYGLAKVRGGVQGWQDLKKMFSPPLIATLVAVVIFLTGFQVPAVIARTCATLGSATIPMSMLVVGTSLGGIAINELLNDWRVYVISFARLIICPVLIWALMRLFVTDPTILGILVILASAPVAMIASVLTIQYDKNEALASKGVFISTILSAVTMPLVIWLLLM
jgi:predicted permease